MKHPVAAVNELLIIRADAGPIIGAGHVMRCLALAQAWARRMGRVLFIGHFDQCIRQRILLEGFEVAELSQGDNGGGLEREIRRMASVKTISWLVLDGYHFNPAYQEAAQEAGFKVLVIDDNGHLPRYDCDILVNQNLHALEVPYCASPDTLLLLGPEYALVRREFLDLRRDASPLANSAALLVTFGGADPANGTLKVIKALKRLNLERLNAIILVGPSNPRRQELEDAVEGIGCNCSLESVVDDQALASLMLRVDMAVTSAGSTCYELAVMAIPFAMVVIAENQKRNAEMLSRQGVAYYCGEFGELGITRLAECLAEFIGNSALRSNFRQKGRLMVDGHGSDRIMEAILMASQKGPTRIGPPREFK